MSVDGDGVEVTMEQWNDDDVRCYRASEQQGVDPDQGAGTGRRLLLLPQVRQVRLEVKATPQQTWRAVIGQTGHLVALLRDKLIVVI